jgi:peptidoglycan hydrolase-like protein with peptidoglycan-binding domain
MRQGLRRHTLVRATAATVVAAVASVGMAATVQAKPGVANLRWGSWGDGVLCVQMALNRADGAGLAEDRNFGPRTDVAVRVFQQKRGLTPDGIVGPNTGNEIYKWDDWINHPWCYNYIPTTF